MKPPREFFHKSGQELEGIVEANRGNLIVLLKVLRELKHRRRNRARRLERTIWDLLTGLDSRAALHRVGVELRSQQSAYATSVPWLDILSRLEPYRFERVVIGALNRILGFRFRPTSRSSDGGVDGIGKDHQGRLTVLQVKRYASNRRIGPDIIRELLGAIVAAHSQSIGLVVTTTYFTKGAQQLADDNGVHLFDGRDLARIMEAAKVRYDFYKRL